MGAFKHAPDRLGPVNPDRTASLLHALASGLGHLPWAVLNRCGDGLARIQRWSGGRELRVTRRNLELAMPELDSGARTKLERAVLRSTGRQMMETMHLWTHSHADNLRLIDGEDGRALFDDALRSGRGLIVSAPHFGNWELLNQWLAAQTPLAILYKPPESKVGEAFLRRVRADEAPDRITQVRAEGTAIRALFKTLAAGGVVGILPDQQPKAGDGEFAPFFDKQALTMTLLNRLAQRTGATVLHAWCQRASDAPRFRISIERADPEIADEDPKIGVAALNRDIERIARYDLAQYQWTYKRYTLRPPGSGEVNPYADFEKHSRPR